MMSARTCPLKNAARKPGRIPMKTRLAHALSACTAVAILLPYNFGRTSSFASDRAFESLQKARLPFRFSQ
jgi:hypothetical protein